MSFQNLRLLSHQLNTISEEIRSQNFTSYEQRCMSSGLQDSSPSLHSGFCCLTLCRAGWFYSHILLYVPLVYHSYKNPLVSPEDRENCPRFIRIGCVVFLFLFASKYSLPEKITKIVCSYFLPFHWTFIFNLVILFFWSNMTLIIMYFAM